jgi:hypothetical protein
METIMNTLSLTSAWDAIILNFLPVFTQPAARIFINPITGWILCTTRRTITGIIPFANPKNKRPHDAYHRLLPKPRWQTAQSRLFNVSYESIFLEKIFNGKMEVQCIISVA